MELIEQNSRLIDEKLAEYFKGTDFVAYSTGIKRVSTPVVETEDDYEEDIVLTGNVTVFFKSIYGRMPIADYIYKISETQEQPKRQREYEFKECDITFYFKEEVVDYLREMGNRIKQEILEILEENYFWW